MREKFTLTKRSWFNRIMLLFVLVCTSAMGRAATVDLGELALDQEYEIKYDYNHYVGVFTAPKDGILTGSGTRANWFFPYLDADHQDRADDPTAFSQTWEMTVTAGQVVYLYGNFSMQAGTFKLTMPGAEGLTLELTSVSPEEGTVASVAAGGMVTAYFNVNVRATGNAEVSVAGTKIGELPVRSDNATLTVEIADLLTQAYDEGKAKADDELVIKFPAVAKNDATATGVFEVKYVCPEKPVSLVSEVHIPASFLSYWVTGDTDGILKLEFSDDLLTEGGEAELGYGDVEAENGYYTETLDYIVDGKVLTVDFSGKLRTPESMLPLNTTSYDVISLKIKNVKDANGNLVYTNNAGSLGSFSYTFPYKVVDTAVDVEFTPENGSSLADVTVVKIWLRGESSLSYDGVKFAYVENGETKEVVVPNSEITREGEEDDEVELVVTVPAELAGKKNITVSLDNLQCADGKSHNIEAKYDSFVITVNLPAEDTMEVLADGTIINVTTNKEVGYIEYEIHDLNAENPDNEIIKSFMWLTKQEDGSWQSEVVGSYPLLRGHDYAVIFTAYATEEDKYTGGEPVGTDQYIIHGAKLPYVNSDLTLVSIDPAPESGLASVDQDVITLTFDGLVKLESETTFINEGMGSTSAFESIEPVEAEGEYANTWKLTVNKDVLASKDMLDISFVAFDQDGKRLNGNEERTGETAFFYYTYKCLFSIPDFTVVPADGAVLTVLDKITVGYEGGINPSWNGGNVCVYNQARDLVATVTGCEAVIPEDKMNDWNYQPQEQILTLDNPVDRNGSYYILFPDNYFNLGSEYKQYNSKETEVRFTIVNNETPGEETNIVATAGDPGVIVLTFDEDVSAGVNYNCTEKILVKNAEGNVVLELTNNAVEIDYALDLNQLVMKAEITEPGEYTIEFPAGLFYIDDFGSVESTAVTVTYVVEGEPVPEIADGTYYLKNVETGMYLTAGNSWGTQASLGAHGLDVVLTALENGKYTIASNVFNGENHYLGSNGYVDSDLTEWAFTKVEDGVYNITLDGVNYIGYDGSTSVMALNLTDPTAKAAQWQLVTKEELLAGMAAATGYNPVDATFLISGQNFSRNDSRNDAWQGAPSIGGASENNCAEKWNCTFDIYQTLTDLPNGVYELSVQGFYRNGGNAEASASHNDGTEALNALLYANEATTPLMSVYAESKEAAEGGWKTSTAAGYVPNSMSDASAVFSAGAYADNKILVEVTDGTLTIGVKKEEAVSNDWTIFDNFELAYLGEEGPLTVNVLSPAETSLPQFPLNGTMVVETNYKDKVGYLVYEVHDLNAASPDYEIVRTQSILKQQEDGTWISEFSGVYEPKFYEGHDYAVVFSAWETEMDYNYMKEPLGTVKYIIHGTTPEYTYSEYALVSFTPDPETTVIESVDQNVFTAIFNGPVQIDKSTIALGMGTTTDFESVTPVDDEDGDGYATTWTLTVDKEWLATLKYALNISIWAKDATDARVQGNSGKGDNSCFMYEYVCTMNVPDFVVTPAEGSTVEKLDKITVSYSRGINYSYQQEAGAAKVLDAEGNVVAEVASYESVIGDGEENASAMLLTLDKEITAAGNYTISFPAVYFYLGSEFDQYNSKATVVNVTVAPTVGIAGVVADADSFTVYSINGVLVLKTADKTELQNLPAGIYIVNGKKYLVK